MIREEELNEAKLLDTLQSNPIGRNEQLDTFIKLLNSIEKNSILTIDGDWGSGKTMFVKQIEYINSHTIEHVRSLDEGTCEKFQEKYLTYYYNAWENDHHEDPLQSLLFNLINDLWGVKDRTADLTVKTTKAFLNSLSKTISLGLYDPQELRQISSISDLTKNITTVNERKNAIDDILNSHLDLKGKKILFIIDELDRCKPTFAVNLLETLKHYYTNDKIVFLLSTNNKQLSHTIKKVYGNDFDGGGYLNKFYDLVFNLPDVDTEKYVSYLGRNYSSSYWKDLVPFEVASHFNLTMREINRYYSSLKLIEGFLSSTSYYSERDVAAQLVKYVFVPVAYALRIHDISNYDKFVKGDGTDIIERFSSKTETAQYIANRSNLANGKPIDLIKKIYTDLFSTNSVIETEDYHIRESAATFKRVVTLMNASGVIDTDATENKNS